MSKKDYIAYKGPEFTIEWYYDSNDKSQAEEYLMNLDALMQQKVFYLFKRLGDFGKISDKTKFRNEGDQIFAFKPKTDRFLSFFVKGKKIIVTNAFQKKSNKLPKDEKRKALECRKDYLKRVKEGSYYEE
jgi:phage-related protein